MCYLGIRNNVEDNGDEKWLVPCVIIYFAKRKIQINLHTISQDGCLDGKVDDLPSVVDRHQIGGVWVAQKRIQNW